MLLTPACVNMQRGDALVHQKRVRHANIAIHHPPAVRDFYLNPDETHAMMADQAPLEREIMDKLAVLKLWSLRPARERLVADTPAGPDAP